MISSQPCFRRARHDPHLRAMRSPRRAKIMRGINVLCLSAELLRAASGEIVFGSLENNRD